TERFASPYGGGGRRDGTSMVATHLSNLHITPIEILESEFPCRITEFSVIADSGGPGEHRGRFGVPPPLSSPAGGGRGSPLRPRHLPADRPRGRERRAAEPLRPGRG